MLYLNLMMPLQIWEYKLLLESMLLNVGWTFTDTHGTNLVGSESYLQYVICHASHPRIDTTLARSAFDVLNGTMIQDLYTTANIEYNPNESSEEVLKLFLLSHPDVVTKSNRAPTRQEIDVLFEPLQEYIKKLYRGYTLSSIMADTPRVKFALIRQFGTWKNYGNDKKLRRYPKLGAQLCSDFVEYAKSYIKIMVDVDDKFGHAGTDKVELIGTVLAYAKYFIPKWMTTKYHTYLDMQLVNGSGESATDLTDFQTVLATVDDDVNIGTLLRELYQINNVLFGGKDGSRAFTGLWYNLVAFYQNIYLGNTLNEIYQVYHRFVNGHWGQEERDRYHYEPLSGEDIIPRIVFNMTRESCLQLYNTDTSRGATSGACRSNSVVFLSSRGTSREYADQSKNYSHRFKNLIPTLLEIYQNLGTIDLTNIVEHSSVWTSNSTTAKDVFSGATEEELTGDDMRADCNRRLNNMSRRYGTSGIPTNGALYEFALVLYGLKSLRHLDEYLNMEGYSIMDIPVESQYNPAVLASIDSIADMVAVRSSSQWRFNQEFDIPVGSELNLLPCPMYTDIQLKRWLSMPVFEDAPTGDKPLPSGNMEPILNYTGDADEDSEYSNREKNYFLNQLETGQMSISPVPEPYSAYRANYIVEHSVDLTQRPANGQMKLAMARISDAEIVMSFMLDPSFEIVNSTYFPQLIRECEMQLQLKRETIKRRYSNTPLTEEALRKMPEIRVKESNLCQFKFAEIKGAVERLSRFLNVVEMSPYCDVNHATGNTDVFNKTISEVRTVDDMLVYIGCVGYMAQGSDVLGKLGPAKPFFATVDFAEMGRLCGLCNVRSATTKMLSFSELWETYKVYTQRSDNLVEIDMDKFIAVTKNLVEDLKGVRERLRDVGEFIVKSQPGSLLAVGDILYDTESNVGIKLNCISKAALSDYEGILFRGKVRSLKDPNVTAFMCQEAECATVYKAPEGQVLMSESRWADINTGRGVGSMDSLKGRFLQLTEDNMVKGPGVEDLKMSVEKRVSEITADWTFKFIDPVKEDKSTSAMEKIRKLKSSNEQLADLKRKLAVRSEDAARLYLTDLDGKSRKVVDLRCVTQSTLSAFRNSQLKKQLSLLGVKQARIEFLSDWEIALNVMTMSTKVVQVLNKLFDGYDRLIATLSDFSPVLMFKKKRRISDDNFKKNRIILAKYSDYFQLAALQDRKSINQLMMHMDSFAKVKEQIRYKQWIDARELLRVLRLSYYMGQESGVKSDRDMETFYRCVIDIANTVFSTDIRRNVHEMVTTLDKFQHAESDLFKIDKAGAVQAKENKQRFELYKGEIMDYVRSPAFKQLALSADRDSKTIKLLRNKYKVDQATGVFYDPKTLRYFLAWSEYPLSTEYNKFDVLVHQAGVLMVLTESETFIARRLEDIEDGLLNAML